MSNHKNGVNTNVLSFKDYIIETNRRNFLKTGFGAVASSLLPNIWGLNARKDLLDTISDLKNLTDIEKKFLSMAVNGLDLNAWINFVKRTKGKDEDEAIELGIGIHDRIIEKLGDYAHDLVMKAVELNPQRFEDIGDWLITPEPEVPYLYSKLHIDLPGKEYSMPLDDPRLNLGKTRDDRKKSYSQNELPTPRSGPAHNPKIMRKRSSYEESRDFGIDNSLRG